MKSDNPDEFYDISIRNKKFGRVDALNGPQILEKYIFLQDLWDKRQANVWIGLRILSKVRRGLTV